MPHGKTGLCPQKAKRVALVMLGTMANHGFLEDIEATSATEIVKLQLCNSELLRPISVYSFRTMDCERGTC